MRPVLGRLRSATAYTHMDSSRYTSLQVQVQPYRMWKGTERPGASAASDSRVGRIRLGRSRTNEGLEEARMTVHACDT